MVQKIVCVRKSHILGKFIVYLGLSAHLFEQNDRPAHGGDLARGTLRGGRKTRNLLVKAGIGL